MLWSRVMAGGDLKLSGASAEIHHEEPWVVMWVHCKVVTSKATQTLMKSLTVRPNKKKRQILLSVICSKTEKWLDLLVVKIVWR